MTRSTLDPDNFPIRNDRTLPPGHDARSLGHSDSSDSGSDLMGDRGADDDTSDRAGTGERLGVEPDTDVRAGADIGFDRVVDAADAGLGDGLDQAEEAQLGITDEEIAARERDAGKLGDDGRTAGKPSAAKPGARKRDAGKGADRH